MKSAEAVRKRRTSTDRTAESEPDRTTARQREKLGGHYGAGPAQSLEGAESVRDDGADEHSRGSDDAETASSSAAETATEAPEEAGGDDAARAREMSRQGSEEKATLEPATAEPPGAESERRERAASEEPPAAEAAGREESEQVSGAAEAGERRAREEGQDVEPVDEESAARRAREEAGSQMVEMPEPDGGGEGGEAAAERRFRLPTVTELESVYKSKTLKIPEDVIKDRVARILHRMKKDGTLKTKDSVATMIGNIFPGPGKFDKDAFKAIVTDVNDLAKIYKTVKDAEAPVKDPDKKKLEPAIDDAVKLATDSAADSKHLKLVFGSRDSAAKTIYNDTATALKTAKASIDTAISTDYNKDDAQTGLGGWANFTRKRMHLELDIAQVKDVKETKLTLIHEGAHLADNSVDDFIYYPDKPGEGFEDKSEATKITNAAHFEEIPRRHLKKSAFPKDTEFKPGVTTSGAKPTFEQKVKTYADNYTREAWDRAVDMHGEFRDFRKEILKGGATPTFNAKKSKILKVSKLLGLTVHEQDKSAQTITQLDLALTEGVARSIAILGNSVQSQTVKAKAGDKGKEGRKLIRALLKKHPELLGSKGWKIVRFMKRNYRTPL